MVFKKISVIFTVMMLVITSLTQQVVEAKTTVKEGSYLGQIAILKDGESNPSMSASFFADDIDLLVNGDKATLSFYIVNKDSTPNSQLKEAYLEYNGQSYTAIKQEGFVNKVFNNSGMSGITPGETYPADKFVVEFPSVALVSNKLDFKAKVSIMPMYVNFDMQITNYDLLRPLYNGIFEGTSKILKDGEQTNSMSAAYFAKEVDLEIQGDQATLNFYVLNKDLAEDSTLRSASINYAGNTYQAIKQAGFVDKVVNGGGMSGVGANTLQPTNKFSVTLPKLSLLNKHFDFSASIHTGMFPMDVTFDMQVNNLVLSDGDIEQPEIIKADYINVETALAKIPSDLSIYTSESVEKLKQAQSAIIYDLPQEKQAEVDLMAKNLETAISELVLIDTTPDFDLADGSYQADLGIMNSGNFDKPSMSQGLFYSEALIEVNGDTSELVMYVINPIPNFPSEDLPLKDFIVNYQGKQYTASLDANNPEVKYFEKSAMFIPTAGEYPTMKIIVEVPTSAILGASKAQVTGETLVTVMNMNVDFYIKLSNLSNDDGDIEIPEVELANYAQVQAALAKIPSDLSIYTTESVEKLKQAKTAIVYDLPLTQQAEVDKMADNLEKAISELVLIEVEKPSFSDGDYTAKLSIRKDGDFTSSSISQNLYHENVDIKVSGEEALLTMYVINPVPNFSDQGLALKDYQLHYANKTYHAKIDEANPVAKMFNKDPMFIPESGMYPTAKVEVKLPIKALIDSSTAHLSGTTFVSVVMNQNVDFYVSLTEFKDSEGNDVGGIVPEEPDLEVDPEIEPDVEEELVPNTNLSDGNYSASLDIRKASDFSSPSISKPLFHPMMDISIKGDNALLTMYLIDPIPNYINEGTPLSNTKLTYQGKTYQVNLIKDSSAIRYFNTAPGFIDKAGNYTTSKLQVSVPKSAINDSLSPSVKVSTYVDAVMDMNQEFYLVINNLKKGNTGASATEPDNDIDEENIEDEEDSTLVTKPNINDNNNNTTDTLLINTDSSIMLYLFIASLLSILALVIYAIYRSLWRNAHA